MFNGRMQGGRQVCDGRQSSSVCLRQMAAEGTCLPNNVRLSDSTEEAFGAVSRLRGGKCVEHSTRGQPG
jgi:hypothetical protein